MSCYAHSPLGWKVYRKIKFEFNIFIRIRKRKEKLENSYKNFISLGYFCEVAGELEKYGLRNASSPFDWMISDFEGVISCIKNEFKDFLNPTYLSQSCNDRSHYKNTKYNFYFFHDFDKYKPLQKQLKKVTEKYKRRSERFLKNIKSETLFVRYISDEIKNENGKSIELLWIEENFNYIQDVIKGFNKNNEIMFIGNDGITSDKIQVFNISPDKNDKVSRKWISKNPYLNALFSNYDFPQKEKNLLRYQRKLQKRNNLLLRANRKLCRILKKIFLKEYIHSMQYDIKDK